MVDNQLFVHFYEHSHQYQLNSNTNNYNKVCQILQQISEKSILIRDDSKNNGY
jgi:hypothetical protein